MLGLGADYLMSELGQLRQLKSASLTKICLPLLQSGTGINGLPGRRCMLVIHSNRGE